MKSNTVPNIDPAKTALTQEFKHTRPLTSCHWDPKSRYVFFGAQDNEVHRYELATGTVTTFKGHDSWVRGLCSSPDGAYFYTGGYDGRLMFWQAEADKPEPLQCIDAHQGWIRAIAVSPNGQVIASCGNDRLVKLWDAKTGSPMVTLAGHQSHVYNLAFSPDSTRIVSCDLKGVVHEWTIGSATPRELLTVEALHGYDTTFRADVGGARSIAMNRDGDQVALGGITNVTNAFAGVGEVAIAVVNIEQAKLEKLLESKEKTRGAAWGVAYHPSGFWIGLSGGGGGGWLYFWNGESNHEVHKLKLKNDGRGMSVAPDHTKLAVAHADSHLRLYALQT